MKTLVGAAEPEPRHPVVVPILTGPQPQWWPVGPGVPGSATTSTTSVVWWISPEKWAAAGPIRVQATVGKSVPEIEA